MTIEEEEGEKKKLNERHQKQLLISIAISC
jgi:hypothetical protein